MVTLWEEGYIGGRTSRRKSDFLFSEEFSLKSFLWRVFSACPALITADAAASESRVLGAESNCQEIPRKKHGTKGPEKHANYSPVKKVGVSGLMIISRRRRCLMNPITDKESISKEGHNPEIHSSEHRRQGEIWKEYVVSCMWRETSNLCGSVIGLISLKYTAALAHTPRRKTRMKT